MTGKLLWQNNAQNNTKIISDRLCKNIQCRGVTLDTKAGYA